MDELGNYIYEILLQTNREQELILKEFYGRFNEKRTNGDEAISS